MIKVFSDIFISTFCSSLATTPQVDFGDLDKIKFEDAAPIPEQDDDEDIGPQFQYYKSEKLLGYLFRAVDEKKIWHEAVQTSVERHPRKMWKILEEQVKTHAKIYELKWKHLREKALELRNMYVVTMISPLGSGSRPGK